MKFLAKSMKKIKARLQKIRFQKLVVTFLYVMVFAVIGFTFWEFRFVNESVNPEIYDKTLDTLLGLLGVTGGLRGAEMIQDTVQYVANCRLNKTDES